MKEIIILLSCILSAYAIAKFLGTHRHIGFFWSMFFSLLLTPVVGLIITILSPKKTASINDPSPSMVILGRMMIVLFGALFLVTTFGLANEIISNRIYGIMLSLGLFGLGVYLVKLGKCNFEINKTN